MNLSPPESALSVKDLKKTYDHDIFKPAQVSLDGLSLTFPKGQSTGLMGHNGAGKTTTIRIILGLIFADQGEVCYGNRTISRNDRTYIGYMPESNLLPKNLNSREVLGHQLRLYGKPFDKNKIEATLAAVGLSQAANKLTGKLSKGMARRLAWAQATIHDPDIMILDEPFSGMDPLGRLHLKDWINEQRRLKKTLIICTHEVDGIRHFCDQIQIIQKGRLVYSTLTKSIDDKNLLFDRTLIRYAPGSSDQEISRSWPKPDHSSLTGGVDEAYFDREDHAQRWLTEAIKAGYKIIYYGSVVSSYDPRLLKLFEGGR